MALAPMQFGPWTPDLPPLNSGITYLRNLFPSIGISQGQVVYQPVPSPKLYANSSLPLFPRGAAVGLDGYEVPHIYVGTATGLYEFDGLSMNWVNATRTSGQYQSGPLERWRYSQYANSLIATNYSDFPQVINMDSESRFSNLTTLVKGKFITQHKGFVILGNTFDNDDGAMPSRIRWSAQDDPFTWTVAQETMSDFQDFPDLGVIQGLVAQDDVYIFCRSGIGRMRFQGSPWVFSFETVVSGKGVSVPESLVTVQGRSFFLDDDGFYEFSGGAPIPIGVGKINDFFKQTFNPSASQTMTAVVDPTRNLIFWNYASNSAIGLHPDTTLIYNYLTGDWSIMDAIAPYIFSSLSLATTIEQLNTYGSIENIPAPFDSPVWQGGVQVLWGIGMDGKIYTGTGEPRQGIIETAELQLALMTEKPVGEFSQTQAIRPMQFGAGDILVSVGTRNITTQNVNWTQNKVTSPVNGKAYVRTSARYHRIRLTLNGDFEKVSGLEITFAPGGNR